MNHYKSNVRDIEFNLFEVQGLGELLHMGRYGDLDVSTARNMLVEVARLAEGPVAESYAAADREPVSLDIESAEIIVPEPLRKSVLAIKEAGWSRLGLPEAMGGIAAPAPMRWAVTEMIHVANSAASFFEMGPQMASVLYEIGNEQQKHWAIEGLERGWAATMVLTEPDAGSDVGAGRTKAVPQSDGTWHIEGVKRFISGGDVGDTAENLFHLVLARPEGAAPGTKGLSLFYVPKFLFDPETLELGRRNGAYVTGLEHKMGLKSSPTCEVSFGLTEVPAVGWLVGDVHDGIAQMFRVIENARMLVGTKATGTLSTGYLNALGYAKERVQGADLTRSADKSAPRVTITHHPEVRRMLLQQKAYAEGLRALYMFAAAHQDERGELAQRVSGAIGDMVARVNDFLLPVLKGVGSERAYDTLKLSLQTLGGSGYLQDYPIEQYVRDTMIDTLYEGTTAIQAQDFFFRKVIRDRGGALGHVMALIKSCAAADDFDVELGASRARLLAAHSDVEAMVGAMTVYAVASQEDPHELYKVGQGAVPLLYAMGDLLVGWRLLESARVALAALANGADGKDCSFYEGKVAVAQYFAAQVLPGLGAARAVISSLDNAVMEIDDSAF
ncbi:acyl-CoA dehydrogenase [Mycolicibacterium sp. lyk4-40-TYG-92]|uniref:acyl-CoA dehydrogenase n=1 Tax=Mycolicibacterium sp. lyk4-40-TYG-92 TaxID=3040295 RepID=UPI002550112F|nr:acyl-CoA dehydrogenase [Mycolicibacterium sp. lyk4-40-TYG-92]